MNAHIELVKKWLADNESVSQQELKDNRDAAYAAYYSAYVAAYVAYDAAGAWVRRYEELTK